jgi:hypothetical protein
MDYGEPRVVRMAVVRGNPSRHVVTLSDGRQVSVPTDSDAYADTSQLAVTSLDTVSRSLEIHTTRGDDAVLEMPSTGGPGATAARPCTSTRTTGAPWPRRSTSRRWSAHRSGKRLGPSSSSRRTSRSYCPCPSLSRPSTWPSPAQGRSSVSDRPLVDLHLHPPPRVRTRVWSRAASGSSAAAMRPDLMASSSVARPSVGFGELAQRAG